MRKDIAADIAAPLSSPAIELKNSQLALADKGTPPCKRTSLLKDGSGVAKRPHGAARPPDAASLRALPDGAPTTTAAALQAIDKHVQRMLKALVCPSCGAAYDERPVKAHTCGHTLCSKCAALARGNSHSPCCGAPVRPCDLAADHEVANIVAAVCQLSDATRPRIFVTGLRAKQHTAVLAALARMGVCAATDPANATHLVTHVNAPARDVARRTRAVHYALARAIPIVDVRWLHACATRGQWLPARPYEAARPAPPPEPVFHKVAARIDFAGKYADDVAAWLRAAGGTVLDGDAPPPPGCRLLVRVVKEIDELDAQLLTQAVDEGATQGDGVACDVVDVAWVSDCLLSQLCPPPVDYADSFYDTQPLTAMR